MKTCSISEPLGPEIKWKERNEFNSDLLNLLSLRRKSKSVTFQRKALEGQGFSVLLFIMLHEMALTFERSIS